MMPYDMDFKEQREYLTALAQFQRGNIPGSATLAVSMAIETAFGAGWSSAQSYYHLEKFEEQKGPREA